MVESVLNITGIREEDNEDVEVISDIEDKKQVAPFLTGFGIPLYSKIISVMLWEITKINNYVNQGIKPFLNRYKNVMMFKKFSKRLQDTFS